MRSGFVVLLMCAMGAAGCGTAHGPAMGKSVGGAAGAVVGRQYGETGIGKSLGSQLGSVAGEMAKSARKAKTATAGQARTADRFCPIGGERYAEDFRYCPYHGVELKNL